MGGIGRTVNKIIPKELRKLDPVDSKVRKEAISTFDSITPKVPEQEEGPVIPLPDEEELARARRRKNASRGGGRASTVMTDDDRLGG